MSKLTKGLYKLCACKAQDVCAHAFWVGYKPKGKARQRASVDDLAGRQVRKLADAIKVQTAFKNAIDENRYVPKRALKAGDPTFHEAMDAYIERYYVGTEMIIAPRDGRKRADGESYLDWLYVVLGEFARATTSDPDLAMRARSDRQRLAIPRRLVKRWGTRAITSLTADDGLELKRELQRPVGADGAERLRAVATINRVCSCAAAFAKWCAKNGPVKDTKYLKASPFLTDGESVLENDAEDNVPDRRVSVDEEARLIQAAKDAGYTMLADLIPFAIDGMMRKSEKRRLKVGDATSRPGWVRVIGTMRKAHASRAKRLTLRKGARVNKTGKTRDVPICTDRMQAIIDRYLVDVTGREKAPHEYLFCDGTGARPAPDWDWQWQFTKLRAHGIPLKFVYEERAGVTKHVPGCRRRFGRPAAETTCPRCLELAGGVEPRARGSNRHGSKLTPECREQLRGIGLSWHMLRGEGISRQDENDVPESQIGWMAGNTSVVRRYIRRRDEPIYEAARRMNATAAKVENAVKNLSSSQEVNEETSAEPAA